MVRLDAYPKLILFSRLSIIMANESLIKIMVNNEAIIEVTNNMCVSM